MPRCTAAAVVGATLCLLLPASALGEEDPEELREELERLEQRIDELEATQTANEEATRTIIRSTLDTLGAQINESVVLGGTLEVVAGRQDAFRGKSENIFALTTAELDFEIAVNDWILGSLVFEYDDGRDNEFTTVDGDDVSVDRFNVDTGYVTLGDTQRFWAYSQLGRLIVPLGISTGDPVADVLTLEDPLTVETFETREDAVLIGFAFPTPGLIPQTPVPAPPPVRPQVLNPLVRWIAQRLGYVPRPPPPPVQAYTTPTAPPPPFHAAIYTFNGDTRRSDRNEGWKPKQHLGATAGFQSEGALPFFSSVPVSIDVDVDFTRSIFDSRLLEFEYRPWLTQIGFVPGMGGSAKLNIGPVSLVGEWNGAIKTVTFLDDTASVIRIRPSAWQVSAAYQLDWNRSVKAIGAQGTYIALGYSQSYDLPGATRLIDGSPSRVGNVARKRYLVSVGEWVLESFRIALEYSYQVDYSRSQGGTGESANGIFSQFTYEW
jgi:hypothetical protein